MLEINLLGPMTVRVQGHLMGQVRTHKCLVLLARLALRQGRPSEREELAELLWPESPVEKGRYNLRRALSDLRPLLLEGDAALVCLGSTLYLHPELAWVDTTEFDRILQGPLHPDAIAQLTRLYSGALLEGWDDEWVRPLRRERKDQFATTLETAATQTIQQARYLEAIALLKRLLLINPFNESAVRSLLSANAQRGNLAEVHQVYRELYERLLEIRRAPAPETVALYHTLVRQGNVASSARPLPPPTPGGPPGGAMPLDSPYYVSRPTEQLFIEALDRSDSIALIKGPRQTGKSTLLARGLYYAKRQGYRVAVTDLATLPKAALQHEDQLLPSLALALAESLELEGGEWKSGLPPMVALQSWVLRLLRTAPDDRIVWALDGIDDLFAQPYRDDFFGLLRSWHTNRAFEPNDPWHRLTVALVYSTEAQHFITDPNQSPFNVGTRLTLTDLTVEEQDTLHQRYSHVLLRTSHRERFRRLVGGHPYLNHQALHAMAEGVPLDNLESAANLARPSPFHGHLLQLQRDLAAEPALREGLSLVLRGETSALSDLLFYRLSSVGLVTGESAVEAQCRCGLYEQFLRRELGL